MNDSVKQDSQDQFVPYEMVSLASMGTHLLFGEIDEEASWRACEFLIKSNLMLETSPALTIMINSPGGVVSDGFAIIDTMTTSRLQIQTVGIGMIASMGILISSAGTKGLRVITKNTEVMAHQFSSALLGKYHDLVASQKFNTRLQQQFINHFKKHSIMTDKQIKDILFSPSDRWLTANECKKYGLCDIVSEYFSPGGPPVLK